MSGFRARAQIIMQIGEDHHIGKYGRSEELSTVLLIDLAC